MDVEALVQPLGEGTPCGTDLEDTQQMAAIDAFRVFGQATPLTTETDWRAINAAALDALGTSHDFRLLAHVAAAQLRLAGLQPFVDSLGVAAHWLEDHFDDVFPRIDDDAVLRKNALNYFADRMAVIDALRRVPLVSHRQLGSFSLRHVAIAAGQQAPSDEDAGSTPTEALINGAFAAAPPEDLVQVVASIDAGLSALKAIESVMVAKQGVQAAPDTEPLSEVLARMRDIVAKHLPVPAMEDGAAAADGGQAGGVPGQIRSREDAVRSLDAVAEFFRRSEPSSPVPMFVERAKGLISRNFLEVLAELAPDSLAEVKRVGGVRDAE
ncbi:MAG: type VI secretion system protein TssA [Casimicrobiaceae bacterium]